MTEPAQAAAQALVRLRQERPLVHHLANQVVAADVAAVTLALGAAPIMAIAAEEVADVARQARAVSLNLGTPSPRRGQALLLAGRAANEEGRPVVFDPVGAGATAFRTRWARRLMEEVRLAVIRGNGGEIGVLAGTGGQVRGVEGVSTAPAARAAATLARQTGAVVALTGERDYVTDGRRMWAVDNGHPLLTSIVGSGCMATAAVACLAAVEADALLAAAAALAAFGLAGERAAGQASGPASFRVALLDELAGLTGARLEGGARIHQLEAMDR